MTTKYLGKTTIEYNKNLIIDGLTLVMTGLLLPSFLSEQLFGIYRSLTQLLAVEDVAFLMIAAVKLILMNAIRALPHYLGVFLISDALSVQIDKRRCFPVNVTLVILVINGVYAMIDVIYGIRYDLGIPAYMVIFFILWFSWLNLFEVSIKNKIMIVLFLISCAQCLDVIPALSNYGFGRGEVSMDIKMIADFLGHRHVLTFFALLIFILLLFCAYVQVRLVLEQQKLKTSIEQNRQYREELYKSQLEAVNLRSYREMQNVVHDLKTPLTMVQGLSSLSEMMEDNPTIKEYLHKMTDAVSRINLMISEILYEDKREIYTTEELIDTIMATVLISVPREKIIVENNCPKSQIMINKNRISRAIINIIDNASQAIQEKESGFIKVLLFSDGRSVHIDIEDNGRGIPKESLEKIWQTGYSEKMSSGLGLPFAKSVIEKHEGTIGVESQLGKYTRIAIAIKEIEE